MTSSECQTLLSDLRSLSAETEWVEFKHNNHSALGKNISALSNAAAIHNERFGYIVFGVEDVSHRIIGTSFNYEMKVKGNEDLLPWLNQMLYPKIHVEFFKMEAQGMSLVMIKIPAAKDVPTRFQGEAFIRIGSSTRPLSKYPAKEALIWNSYGKTSFEQEVIVENLTQTEVFQQIDYHSLYSLFGLPVPQSRGVILQKLIEEKLVVKTLGGYGISNLGVILMARSLKDHDHLFRKAIRLIVYKGNNRLVTKGEITGDKGYANGFEGLINYVDREIIVNEEIGKAFRKNISRFPILAIRELIANAIIHQDFSISGAGPTIEIFDDRMEITNPGKPLISPMRFLDHSPRSRNERLAYFMRRAGICEERGSGIDKVISECENSQLPAPRFIEEENATRVVLYAFKKLRQMTAEDKMRACYFHACLKYVSNDFMTNQSLRLRFGIEKKNYSIVSRIIADTIKKEWIRDFDPDSNTKRYAKYIPIWA